MEQREPEPSRELAWTYCQAYFDDATNSMFQFINRETFETKLAAYHNEDQTRAEQDNAAWYALRNAVFATGCRKTISEQSNPRASKAQVQSWKYFQNALSVFAELAFDDASILNVQALTVMVSSIIPGLRIESNHVSMDSDDLHGGYWNIRVRPHALCNCSSNGRGSGTS